MDIREAKYLLEIAKTKNITKAATNLYITQPGLSKSLNKLEEEFEAPLFFREKNNLEPTPLGEIVLSYSRQIVDIFNDMYMDIQEAKQKTEDVLRISLPYSGSFLFSDIVSEFAIEYPNISLYPHELGGIQVADMFNNHELDIAFAMPTGTETQIDLIEHRIIQSEVMVSIRKDHPLASKDKLKIKDLDGYEYTSFDSTSQIYKNLNEIISKEEASLIPKMLGHDYMWLISYAKKLNIPCILPKPCLDNYGDDELVSIPFDPVFEWQLCLAYPAKKQRSEAIQAFVKFALSKIGY